MSITNLIVQQPAGYLITDSGWWDLSGRICSLHQKVVALPQLDLAFSGRGYHEIVAAVWREIDSLRSRLPSIDGGDVVDAFPDIYFAACAAQGVPGSGKENLCDISLIHYSRRHNRAFGFLIANIVDGMGGTEPYQLVPVGSALSLDIDPDAPLGTACDINDPSEFDIRADGRRLVDRQRQVRNAAPPFPEGHHVAGSIHLTTAGPSGLSVETLAHYPDLVGWPVDPSLAASVSA